MPDGAFGQIPPQMPMSPFAMGGHIGMSYQQYQGMLSAPMFPGLEQFGPLAGGIGNMILPMIQNMFAQRQMAAGFLPAPGQFSPFQNMQNFMMMQNMMQATQMAAQQDLQQRYRPFITGLGRGLGMAGQQADEFARSIVQAPGAGIWLPQFMGAVVPGGVPGGTTADMSAGLSMAFRGLRPGEIHGLSQQLFRQLSVGGMGERLDPRLTGGLQAGRIGELAFEMQRRGALSLISVEQAEQLLGETAGRMGGRAQGLMRSEQGRMAAVERLRATDVRRQLGNIADVVGMIQDLMGPGQPIHQILTALENISGQTVGGLRRDPERIRQQLQGLTGMASLLGIAPQAAITMAQATAMQFEAQGLPAQFGIPAAMENLATIAGVEGAVAQAPTFTGRFGVSPQRIQRGAGQLQAAAVASPEARIIGMLRGLRAMGAESRALEAFFDEDPQQRAAVLGDPRRRRQLMRAVSREADPRMLSMTRRMGAEAAQFLDPTEDLMTLRERQAQEIRGAIARRLQANGMNEEAQAVMSGDPITSEETQARIMAATAGMRRLARGIDVPTLLAFADPRALARTRALRREAASHGELITSINRAARAGGERGLAGVLSAISEGRPLGEIVGAGFGQVDVERLRGVMPENFRQRLEAITQDETLTDEERKTKMAAFNQELMRELTTAPFTRLSQLTGRSVEELRKSGINFEKVIDASIRQAGRELEDSDTKPDPTKAKERMEEIERVGQAFAERMKGVFKDLFGGSGGLQQTLHFTLNIDGETVYDGDIEKDGDGNMLQKNLPMRGGTGVATPTR